MRTFLAIVGGLMAVCVIFAGIWGAAYAVGWVTAPWRGAADARETIQADGNFRIQAYTQFYNMCTSIQALERDIDQQIALLKTSTIENEQRILRANVAGLGGTRDGAIAKYNNDSQKQWTIAQFKSEALAYELPTSPYVTVNSTTGDFVTGVKTECVVR